MVQRFDLVIVGAGAASVAALHRLAHTAFRGTIGLVGSRQTLGFHQARAEHLLNTRAAAMAISPDAPDDFVTWAKGRGLIDGPHAFAHRRTFGAYLDASFQDALTRLSPGSLRHNEAARVTDITRHEGGYLVHMSPSEDVWLARHIVCAIGFGTARSVLHPDADNPWTAQYELLAQTANRVCIVGAGLSGLDAAQSLLRAGYKRDIVIASALGRSPFVHRVEPGAVTHIPRNDLVASQWLGALRKGTRSHDWRDGLDAARPDVAAVWNTMAPSQRARLLRSRVMDLWSIHRHRAPPETAIMLAQAIEAGTVQYSTTRVHAIERETSGAFTLHGSPHSICVDHVIDARGPNIDLCADPLYAALLQSGLVQRSASGVGVLADKGFALHRCGQGALYAIGAAHYGERLETTGFVDLRAQAVAVTDAICQSTA